MKKMIFVVVIAMGLLVGQNILAGEPTVLRVDALSVENGKAVLQATTGETILLKKGKNAKALSIEFNRAKRCVSINDLPNKSGAVRLYFPNRNDFRTFCAFVDRLNESDEGDSCYADGGCQRIVSVSF